MPFLWQGFLFTAFLHGLFVNVLRLRAICRNMVDECSSSNSSNKTNNLAFDMRCDADSKCFVSHDIRSYLLWTLSMMIRNAWNSVRHQSKIQSSDRLQAFCVYIPWINREIYACCITTSSWINSNGKWMSRLMLLKYRIPNTEYQTPNTELLCFILYLHLHSDLVFHFHTLQSPVFDKGWLLFIPTSFHSIHSISYWLDWLDIWCWCSVSYLYLCVFFFLLLPELHEIFMFDLLLSLSRHQIQTLPLIWY